MLHHDGPPRRIVTLDVRKTPELDAARCVLLSPSPEVVFGELGGTSQWGYLRVLVGVKSRFRV